MIMLLRNLEILSNDAIKKQIIHGNQRLPLKKHAKTKISNQEHRSIRLQKTVEKNPDSYCLERLILKEADSYTAY